MSDVLVVSILETQTSYIIFTPELLGTIGKVYREKRMKNAFRLPDGRIYDRRYLAIREMLRNAGWKDPLPDIQERLYSSAVPNWVFANL